MHTITSRSWFILIAFFVFQLVLVRPILADDEINAKYRELGGNMSFLGEPISQEKTCQENEQARYRHFEGGSIYYHPSTGAHEIHGPIKVRWEKLGGYSEFGFPITDVRTTFDQVGLHSEFFKLGSSVQPEDQYRSIFWHPQYRAQEVIGPIRTRWKEADWAKGWLGYPMSGQYNSVDQVCFNRFENGYIFYVPHTNRGAKAVGYGPYAENSDPCLNLCHSDMQKTPYGNLKKFNELMWELHGIDLYRAKVRVPHTKTKIIENWHIADFSSKNKLDGICLSEKTRLVITIAQLFLMQWHFLDLPNHMDLRKEQINRYFKSDHCFRRNYDITELEWSYNDWCSEFVSYIYKRSGNPRYYGKKQTFWCNGIGQYEKIGWCFSRASYCRGYFRDHNLNVSISDIREKIKNPPQLGDYISFEGHSMLVVGFVPNKDNYGQSIVYIVEGNSGSGAPQKSNKKVHFGSLTLDDSRIVSVGRMGLHDYAIQEPPSGAEMWFTEPRGIPEEQVQPLALRKTEDNKWELRAFFPPQKKAVDLYIGFIFNEDWEIYFFDKDNKLVTYSSDGFVPWRQGVKEAQWDTIFSLPADSIPFNVFDGFNFFSFRTIDPPPFDNYDWIIFSGAWQKND